MAEFVYIDETGSVGKGASKQPFLLLAAVVVPEERVRDLTDRLFKLAFKHLGWVPQRFEWHAQELWNAAGHWQGKTPPQLLAAYEEAIGLLEDLDIWVLHSSIDKARLHKKYDGEYDHNAYLLALQFLLEKLESHSTGKLRVVVADEAKEQHLRAVGLLRDMQRWGRGPVPSMKLNHVIDSLHYVDSRDSPGVQLADLVAFMLHRSSLPTQGHPDADAAVNRMRTAIEAARLTWRASWP